MHVNGFHSRIFRNSKQGDTDNHLSLGDTAFKKRDYATALREWTPLANRGDADAQFGLGYMYANGEGVPQNSVRACLLYTSPRPRDS